MSVHDVPQVLSSPPVPWVEPGHRAAGARPNSEYWDVTTACWRSAGPQAG